MRSLQPGPHAGSRRKASGGRAMNAPQHPEAKAVRHIPWAFSLDDAPQLPVTGEQHPLRRETRPVADLGQSAHPADRRFGRLAPGWWYSHRQPPARPVMRPVKIVRYTDLGVPPSIATPTAPQINVAEEVAKSPLRRPPIARARTGGRREGPGQDHRHPDPRWPKRCNPSTCRTWTAATAPAIPCSRCRHRHLAVARPTSSPSTRSPCGQHR